MQKTEQNAELNYRIASLTHQLDQLKKAIYGSRHERFIPLQNNPAQITLDLNAEQVATCNIIDVKKISYLRTTAEVIENKKGAPWTNEAARAS